MADLDGPRLAPRAGVAKQLVIFLHGYGADGNDLIDIGRAWQQLLPDAAFVSPHAPRPCGQAPMGREWFPLTFRDPNERWDGVNAAAPVLNAFIDTELKRHNLADSALALVGFSQGTMMALHVGLRRAAAPAAIVGYSGMLVTPPNEAAPILERFLDAELKRRDLPPSALALVGFSQGTMMSLHVGLRRPAAPVGIVGYSGMLVMPEDVDVESFTAEIRSKPPVLLIHGDTDQLIPVQALFHAAQSLAALGIPAQWHISSGVGHGIDQEGLRQGGEFLAKCFAAGK